MLDRKKYDKEITEFRESVIKELSRFFDENTKLIAELGDNSIGGKGGDVDLKAIEDWGIPRNGNKAFDVGEEMIEKVLSKSMSLQHPRFYSFVTSAVSPYAVLGSILCDLYNPNVAGFSLAPEACLIEEKLVKWMGSLAGFDEGKSGGLFTSGGSLSNLTGIIAARNTKLKDTDYAIGTAYLSDQAHSSIKKGVMLAGIRRDNIKIIETDDEYKIRIDLLEKEIEKDIKAGLKPFLVVGNLGSTNTGTIDPLKELGAIAEKYGTWFHVDGAYGGSILLSDIYRNLTKGLEKADSFSWDWHKWALQPYACSTLIAKDKQNLINTYAEHPEYLADIITADHNDGWDLGIEMSRPARALKVWYTIQAMGTDAMSDIIDYAIYNSHIAEKELKKNDCWEIISRPSCGAINFRCAPKGYNEEELNALNKIISAKMNEDGFAYIVTTVLKGKTTLRMCIINGNTNTDDVVSTIEKLNEIANSLVK